MTSRRKCILWTACVAVAALAAFAAVKAWQYWYDRKSPNFGRTAEIYVLPDTPKDSVRSQIFRRADVIRAGSLDRAFGQFDAAKPGHYTISPGNSSMYVARMLSNGWQTPVTLVLPNTMRLRGKISRDIASQLMLDSTDVADALQDSALLAKFGFTPESEFALFVPDNYEVWWTDSMEAIMAKQKEAYDKFWTPENEAKAKSLGLTKMQVSILASIVKGETNHEPEMPKIAAVYLNRLRMGMKLQADPTVAYCYDYALDRIRHKHLSVDSPYNTYKYAGLPPNPICVPTRACMEAVLNPAAGDWLFFCASPEFNGTHRFARSYQEHMENAREFQRALNRRAAGKRAAS